MKKHIVLNFLLICMLLVSTVSWLRERSKNAHSELMVEYCASSGLVVIDSLSEGKVDEALKVSNETVDEAVDFFLSRNFRRYSTGTNFLLAAGRNSNLSFKDKLRKSVRHQEFLKWHPAFVGREPAKVKKYEKL